jgi:hypothetical protein
LFVKPKQGTKRSEAHPFEGLVVLGEPAMVLGRLSAKVLSHLGENSKDRWWAVAFVAAEVLAGRSLEAELGFVDMVLNPVTAVDNCIEVGAVEQAANSGTMGLA